MNAQHTPGPWRYNPQRIGIESETAWSIEPDPATGEEGSRVEVIHTQGAMGGNITADLALIAAAPALLAALSDLTAQCQKWAPTIDRSRAVEALRLARGS